METNITLGKKFYDIIPVPCFNYVVLNAIMNECDFVLQLIKIY